MAKIVKKTVVIAGGGFGGVRAALDLSRHACDLDIILIDKNGYHTFTPDCYKLLTPVMSLKLDVHFEPASFRLFFSSVTVPLAEIFEGRENVELVFDEVSGIDPLNREVATSSGRSFGYDWLIVASGSVTNFFDIPGLRARALEFKTASDALNLRNEIDEVFSRKGKDETINIVVGGGGFTGCEVAGELAEYLRKLSKIHNHPMSKVKLLIIEASPVLLGAAGEWASQKARERLEKVGVEMIFADPIIDVRDANLALKSSKIVEYDVLLWTAGVKASLLTGKIAGITLGKNACVPVNEYLQASASPNIFAIGDAAFCLGLGDKPLPMTAQIAVSQARFVAYAVKRLLRGRKIFKYRPGKSNLLIPLGPYYTIAILGRLQMAGFWVWILKRLAALRYFLSILPFGKALKLWLKGVRF